MSKKRIALQGVHPNMEAFLLMIQHAEGTDKYSNPYNVLFGGGVFSGYAKHPGIAITKGAYTSTAAGAYQILKRTAESLKMASFTPEAQDQAAINLIKRRGGYNAVIAGNFSEAIDKCKKEWASLPGAGYGQPEKNKKVLLAFISAALSIIPGAGLPVGESDAEKKNLYCNNSSSCNYYSNFSYLWQ